MKEESVFNDCTKLLIDILQEKLKPGPYNLTEMILGYRDGLASEFYDQFREAILFRIDKEIQAQSSKSALLILVQMRQHLVKTHPQGEINNLGDNLLLLCKIIENIGRIHAGSADLIKM